MTFPSVRLAHTVRISVGEKIMDVGNLLLAALVLGQVVSTTKNIGIMIVGAAGFCLTYVIGISIMATKARRKK